ncbi:acyl-CoA thioesterase [Streptomyces sp. NPDC048172]|uniref:acyl-CoA thioesterase n=1 Tax=Streptomyces sp. NPDC048172 TaxID=3365505 RepID=UPI00371E5258
MPQPEPEPPSFSVPVTVRGYETDVQGHLNQAVYLQYAEHARWSLLRAAGIEQTDLVAAGVGPVVLETTVKYLRELRAGDDVEISCAFEWTEGRKVHAVRQTLRKADGTLAATVDAVGGILDLTTRRLVEDPRKPLTELASDPAVLGLVG